MGQVGIMDNASVLGHLKFEITNYKTGAYRVEEYDNLILDTYLTRIAEWSAGVNNVGQNPALPPSRFLFGTGTGTVQGSDVSLFAHNLSSLINVTSRTYNGGVTTITINYPPNTVTGTFTEGGLMDSNGVLLTHVVLSPSLTIAADESVSLTYTLTFQA